MDTVIRTVKKHPYGVIKLTACDHDADLSWKAVGLLHYLVSRPDGWKFNHKDLINRHCDGKAGVRSGLELLRECGYLVIVRMDPESDSPGEWTWHISEDPLSKEEWNEYLDHVRKSDHDPCPKIGPHNKYQESSKRKKKTLQKKKAVPLPKSWKPNEAHTALAEEQKVDLSLEVEQFRDHALANGRTQKNWDAAFRTWLRNAGKWQRDRQPPRERTMEEELGDPVVGWVPDR